MMNQKIPNIVQTTVLQYLADKGVRSHADDL
jgi:hypothetical protein